MQFKATGIEECVQEDIAKRQMLGRNKYGLSVKDNPLPLKDWLQHAYEECLDQAVYLKRAMYELAIEEGRLLEAETIIWE
jgi:hypothetical protein